MGVFSGQLGLPNRLAPLTIWAVLVALLAASLAEAELKLVPYRESGVYDMGEKVGWKVSASETDSKQDNVCKFTVKKNNQELIKEGELDLSLPNPTIEVQPDEPEMIYVEVTPPASGKKSASVVAGAAVAPTKIRPSAPRPDDFDAFWSAKLKAIERTPASPLETPKDSGDAAVEYATIRMDNINDSHIYGQLAKPKREGKFPAVVIFQWASPPYPLQKAWVAQRAAEGWLALNIEPHDVLPDEPQSYYNALPESIKHYEYIGSNDRDKSYFLRMYLGDYRALDYVTSRPDWDGKTLVVMGISMGGQQSLCVAGLHPKVTHLIVNVPAGCDTNGPLYGRQSSYPNFPSNDPQVMQTALYFDAVNFSPRIKATSLVAMGFVDTISAPAGIWTAFNQISAPKEAVPMVDSPHNHLATPAQQRPYNDRSAEWLSALIRGGQVRPRALDATAR